MREGYEITSEDIEYFKSTRELAYKGEAGRRRRDYSIEYTGTKKAVLDKVRQEAAAREARGEKYTCHKGCSLCCVQYIEASVNECEVITCYLYDNMDVFFNFIEQYPIWRRKTERYGDPLSACEQALVQLRKQGNISGAEQVELDEKLLDYQTLNVPCPFLHNDICSIYEVQPYTCATHYVTGPAEFCSPFHPARPEIHRVPLTDDMRDLSLYGHKIKEPLIFSMPHTVYEILCGGLLYITRLTGLKIPDE
ncbi:hypothetical protein ACFLYQ_06075 [Chloroflexota bacterium]